MGHTFKFAIAGCGKIAQRHAEEIVKHGSLAAVCDLIPEKARSLADKYGASVYVSIDELLDRETQVEVIVICTPNGLHAEHSIKSLKAGKHVLCEKPMCLSVADAADMKDAANRYQRELFVVKQNRFNPPVVRVKELIAENVLGRILSVQVNGFWNRPAAYYTKDSWKGTKKYDGGILYTQFSHFIDILYWLVGDIKKVKCLKKKILLQQEIEFEDNCVAIAEFACGAIGTLHFSVNAFEKNMEGSLTILAENGSVKIGGQYLNTLEYQHIKGLDPLIIGKGNAAGDYGFYSGSMSNHDKVYEQLINALSNAAHSMVSADEAMKSVEIIERIYNSAGA